MRQINIYWYGEISKTWKECLEEYYMIPLFNNMYALYCFTIATLTNYYKLSGLKEKKFFQFWLSEM